MIETPLNLTKKHNHHCRSALISSLIVRKPCQDKPRRPLRSADIKIRPGRTQAVTKDINPSNDCKRQREMVEALMTDLIICNSSSNFA